MKTHETGNALNSLTNRKPPDGWLPITEIERRVCEVTSKELGIRRERVLPRCSLIEDFGCDSLDVVELIMTIEEAFSVTLPDEGRSPVYKAIFTRQPFRLCDLAELVYIQQGTGAPEHKSWRKVIARCQSGTAVPFTQLGGRWEELEASLNLLKIVGRRPTFAGGRMGCVVSSCQRRPSKSAPMNRMHFWTKRLNTPSSWTHS